MWVLIGYGANSLQIPAMFWSDRKQAVMKCTEMFGFEPAVNNDNTKFTWIPPKGNRGEFSEEIASKFFTSYYDGCGSPTPFVLKQVAEGTPFVPWDLD